MDSSDDGEEMMEMTVGVREDEDRRPMKQQPISPGLTRAQAVRLYVSHAFSTWNARGYEFAAVSHSTTSVEERKGLGGTEWTFVNDPRLDPIHGGRLSRYTGGGSVAVSSE